MQPRVIQSLEEIADRYETFFVDMYGVIWNGLHFYPSVAPLFADLKKCGKKIAMLSNATTVSPRFVEKYAKFGLVKGVNYDAFITSGDVLKAKIADGYFEKLTRKKEYRFYILGRDNPALFEHVAAHQTHDLNAADLMYVSSLEVDKQAALSLDKFMPDMQTALQKGLPLVCANPDLFAFRGDLKYYRGGSVAKWYAANGGFVAYVGKPYGEIYEFALKKTDSTAACSVMVGDTLGTDILGAVHVGMDSVLITGKGSMTYDDLKNGKTLAECFKDADATPQYLLDHV